MRIRNRFTMQLSESKFENYQGLLHAEASELGLRPGEWPESIDLRCSDGRIIVYRKGEAEREVKGDQLEVACVWYEPDASDEGRMLIIKDLPSTK